MVVQSGMEKMKTAFKGLYVLFVSDNYSTSDRNVEKDKTRQTI